ncbi:MAG: ribonuclease HI [Christensenellaceae bacterium]|jgi:ribonuclease HI|nr:ribonuclease HI [Christensenellaceae bacterium]
MGEQVLKIYTDGACSGNPGKGGWACVLVYGDKRKELSGFERETTNNRMELTAVIKGLEAVKVKVKTEIYSDSSYVVDAFNKGWLKSWQKNAWKNSQKQPVKNRDLWERLAELAEKFAPTFIWVKGHASNEFNNRCDELAVAEYKSH